MLNIILVNGPPGSGKDHFYKYIDLCHSNINPYHFKFAQPIRDFLKAVYDFTDEDIIFYKDIKHPKYNKSIREIMIDFSENFIKKLHGSYFFADQCANSVLDFIEDLDSPTIILTDCGFNYEVQRFIDIIQERITDVNFQIVRLYGKYDFSGDSRSYIEIPGIPTTNITNTYNRNFHMEIDKFLSNNII